MKHTAPITEEEEEEEEETVQLTKLHSFIVSGVSLDVLMYRTLPYPLLSMEHEVKFVFITWRVLSEDNSALITVPLFPMVERS